MCSPGFLPIAPRPQTWGFGGFSVLYRSRISDELLLGFNLLLGPLFHISKLYPFCYLGQKCSCVAPGKTLSNLDDTLQTPASCTAPSLCQCTAISVLRPAPYCQDRKRSVWVWCLRGSREPVCVVSHAASHRERADSLSSFTTGFKSELCYSLCPLGQCHPSVFIYTQ